MTCPHCHRSDLTRRDFYNDAARPSGRSAWCARCVLADVKARRLRTRRTLRAPLRVPLWRLVLADRIAQRGARRAG